MASAEDEEYEVPLRDQRYFGAGIKRKLIKFVPSTTNEPAVQSLPTTPSQSAAEKYLSIVFRDAPSAERSASAPLAESAGNGDILKDTGTDNEDATEAVDLDRACDICGRSVTIEDSVMLHESSIAHQICLQHSHPPSHINRRRRGLAVLERQGWDLDSRRGLGAEGEGILHPIKAKENPERAGLGVNLADLKANSVTKPGGLDAGKIRLIEKEDKNKAERLRNAFYRNDDIEKYLGAEDQMNETLDLKVFKRARRR